MSGYVNNFNDAKTEYFLVEDDGANLKILQKGKNSIVAQFLKKNI